MISLKNPGTTLSALGLAGLLAVLPGCGGGGGGTSPSPSPSPTQATATISVYNTGGVAAGSFSVAATQVTLNEGYLADHGVATAELDLDNCALRHAPSDGPLGVRVARSVSGGITVTLANGGYELWCGERQYAAENQSAVSQGMGAGLLGRVVEYRLIRPGEDIVSVVDGHVLGTGRPCGTHVQDTIDAFNAASTLNGRALVTVRLVEESSRVIGCAECVGAEGWHSNNGVIGESFETIGTLLIELEEAVTGTQNVHINGDFFARVHAWGYTPMGASTLRLAEVLAPE